MKENRSRCLKKLIRLSASVLIFGGIFLAGVIFVHANSDITCTEDLDGKTDKELELALQKCEKEIEEQKNLLDNKQRESVTIERDIAILDYKIDKAQADIKAREIKIVKIGTEIDSKELEIIDFSVKTENMQASLAELMRKTDELETYSLVETLLSNESLSDFFVDVDNFGVLKKELRISLSEIRDLKERTEEAKYDLEDKERNERGLKIAKEQEKRKTANYKSDKENLLSMNREEEEEYKQTIAEKEKIKKDIRTRIFRTVGGLEISFGDALALVQPYEERIGVESALVLAVLFQESGANGVIGGNLGKCTYNQKNSHGNDKYGWTVMSNSQKPSFIAIMKELGMDPDTKPVSCPIPSDGSYGGAMGPAQFMPNTWWDVRSPGDETGYKKRIAKVLGIKTPSPFINLDAFVGTMLYLSDARYRCASAFSSTYDIWSCTSAKYYSGLYNTTANTLGAHMRGYGSSVANRALAFQKDIDTLGL